MGKKNPHKEVKKFLTGSLPLIVRYYWMQLYWSEQEGNGDSTKETWQTCLVRVA